jgi:hypothetical protein
LSFAKKITGFSGIFFCFVKHIPFLLKTVYNKPCIKERKKNCMKGTVKTRKRAGRLALALTGWLALAAAVLLLADGRTVRFYRSGEEEMSIEYGTAYEETGVYAVTTGRLFGEG